MKAISHFIRQFRCRLREPGASTAVHTSARVLPLSVGLSPAPGHAAPPSSRLAAQPAGPAWAAGGQCARAAGCFSWATLLPDMGGHLGTAEPPAGSARSQRSLAVVVNSSTTAASTAPLGAGHALQPRAAGCPPLPSFPAHCSPAAPRLPFWHSAVRGWALVWEPSLGAALAAAFLSCLPTTGVPRQSQRTH